MKKLNRKVITLSLLIILGCALLFAGCNRAQHNAMLFDNAQDWMRDDFLMNNWVRGATVFPDEWKELPDFEEWLELFIDRHHFPSYQKHIVTEQGSFEEIFKEFPPGVDFESQMLVIYIISNGYSGTYRLRSLTLSDDQLHMAFRRRRRGRFGAPHQRAFVVRMDKQNITEVHITFYTI